MAVQIKKPKAIEEIIVKGKKPTTGFTPGAFARTEFASEAGRGKIAGLTRAEFVLGKEKAAGLDKLLRDAQMEEIVVKAKRLPKPPIGFVNAFAGPFLFAADIAAEFADVISQKRLDEAGRIATLTDPPKPDTPLVTITPEIIPEIVVTAKRPIQKVAPAPSQLIDQEWFFRETFPGPGAGPGARPGKPKRPLIEPPKIGKIGKKISKIPKLISSVVGGPGTGSLVEPLPRSLALGIGKPKLGNALRTGLGSGLAASLQPQTSPQTSGGCQPCPRPKKKPRTKCYRGLVKQGRYASRDKISKWAEIDCDSGRTLKELK